MKTIGSLIKYLSKFPKDWKVFVTRSDEGGELIPYLEGKDYMGQKKKEICLTTPDE